MKREHGSVSTLGFFMSLGACWGFSRSASLTRVWGQGGTEGH